jgi:hypothetical protein
VVQIKRLYDIEPLYQSAGAVYCTSAMTNDWHIWLPERCLMTNEGVARVGQTRRGQPNVSINSHRTSANKQHRPRSDTTAIYSYNRFVPQRTPLARDLKLWNWIALNHCNRFRLVSCRWNNDFINKMSFDESDDIPDNLLSQVLDMYEEKGFNLTFQLVCIRIKRHHFQLHPT